MPYCGHSSVLTKRTSFTNKTFQSSTQEYFSAENFAMKHMIQAFCQQLEQGFLMWSLVIKLPNHHPQTYRPTYDWPMTSAFLSRVHRLLINWKRNPGRHSNRLKLSILCDINPATFLAVQISVYKCIIYRHSTLDCRRQNQFMDHKSCHNSAVGICLGLHRGSLKKTKKVWLNQVQIVWFIIDTE